MATGYHVYLVELYIALGAVLISAFFSKYLISSFKHHGVTSFKFFSGVTFIRVGGREGGGVAFV